MACLSPARRTEPKSDAADAPELARCIALDKSRQQPVADTAIDELGRRPNRIRAVGRRGLTRIIDTKEGDVDYGIRRCRAQPENEVRHEEVDERNFLPFGD